MTKKHRPLSYFGEYLAVLVLLASFGTYGYINETSHQRNVVLPDEAHGWIYPHQYKSDYVYVSELEHKLLIGSGWMIFLSITALALLAAGQASKRYPA